MQQPKTLASILPKDLFRSIQILCPKHGDVEASSVRFSDGWSEPKCGQCYEENASALKLQRDKRDAVEKARSHEAAIARKIDLAKIPIRFQSQLLETYLPADDEQRKALATCRAYAEDFAEAPLKGQCLILHGTLGTGKTHLACGILQHIIRTQLGNGLYQSFSQAVRSVKETYGGGSDRTEQQAIDAFAKPDLLVIDEVGVQFGSEAEKLIGFEILNARYEAMKPTIIVSNLDLKGLTETLGERVIDRLRENGGKLLTFTGKSHRGVKPAVSP